MPASRRATRPLLLVLGLAAVPGGLARAQIRVNPTGVNVSSQGATSVFLTFGGVDGYQAVEALWCGELIPAAPAIGQRCDPATIFGSLPFRYDLATGSGTGALTDIMTILPSVARRAYQAAETGAASAFFYVRRFRSLAGGPDQYVAVTCRMTGGGARTPLSLTDVRLEFLPRATVLEVAEGETPPAWQARIAYTGTGRLTGRWEIVLPGEELPTREDLLTEASLPREQRGTQRRYTQLSRFNVFLPPTGRVTLPGPDPDRLPTAVDGVYYLLLRVEATEDKEGDSDLGAVGAGTGIVPGGAVAGFPMPVLRYVVGSGQPILADLSPELGGLVLLSPRAGADLDPASPLTFTWQAPDGAAISRVEVETERGEPLVSALVAGAVAGYRAPPWLAERAGGGAIRWRVVATDPQGRVMERTEWRGARWKTP